MSLPRFIVSLALVVLCTAGLATSALAHGDPAVSATINPAMVIMTADQTQAFVVMAKEADGHQTDVTGQATFSTDDPMGVMSGATYHPGKAGTWAVQASFQSFTTSTTVTVTGGLVKEVTINPNSDPEFVNLGTPLQFSASGFDASSNVVTNVNFAWSVTGDIGTINENGLFTPTNAGSGKVMATAETTTAEVSVVVKEPEKPLVANTNIAQPGPGNTNTTVNANTAPTNTNTAPIAVPPDDVPTTCKTLATWLWVAMLILFLLGVSILYALVPMKHIWPPVIALGGALALVMVQRSYGCSLLNWWGWVLAGCTLGLTILAARQIPTGQKP